MGDFPWDGYFPIINKEVLQMDGYFPIPNSKSVDILRMMYFRHDITDEEVFSTARVLDCEDDLVEEIISTIEVHQHAY